MHVHGKTRLPATPVAVWAALQDPDVLARCISRCEHFERLTATTYLAVTRVKAEPLRLRIPISITLEDLDPPATWTIKAIAKSPAGAAQATTRITLTGTDKETELSYSAKAALAGKLALLSFSWSDAAIKPALAKFFARLAAILEERADQTPPSNEPDLVQQQKPDTPLQPADSPKPAAPHKTKLSSTAWMGIGTAAGIAAVAGIVALLRRR